MKINNISKRIIAGMMGAIMLVPMAGCGQKDNISVVEEHKDDISYDDLTDCYLVEINIGISPKLFICKRNLVNENKESMLRVDEHSIYQYVDLISNDEIYNQKVLSGEKYDTLDIADLIRANDNIEDYLIYYNEIQPYYSKDDIQRIIGKIYQIYEYSGNNDIQYKIKKMYEDNNN